MGQTFYEFFGTHEKILKSEKFSAGKRQKNCFVHTYSASNGTVYPDEALKNPYNFRVTFADHFISQLQINGNN